MSAKRNAKISTKSQGDKVVSCARCAGDIAPYTGRAVSLISSVYAHQPGKCQDQPEIDAQRHADARQGELFAWSCQHVEPSYNGQAPQCCTAAGTDRAEFADHMRGHGKTLLPVPARIRLRKRFTVAGKPSAVLAQPFKMLTWTEHYDTWTGDADSIYGQRRETTEVTKRGQFWSDGPDAHSIWAVTYTAPGSGQRPEFVLLYVSADGTCTRNWSDARQSRREANRRQRELAA